MHEQLANNRNLIVSHEPSPDLPHENRLTQLPGENEWHVHLIWCCPSCILSPSSPADMIINSTTTNKPRALRDEIYVTHQDAASFVKFVLVHVFEWFHHCSRAHVVAFVESSATESPESRKRKVGDVVEGMCGKWKIRPRKTVFYASSQIIPY